MVLEVLNNLFNAPPDTTIDFTQLPGWRGITSFTLSVPGTNTCDCPVGARRCLCYRLSSSLASRDKLGFGLESGMAHKAVRIVSQHESVPSVGIRLHVVQA